MNRNRTLQLVLKHGRLIFGRDFPAEEKSAALDWLDRHAAQGCSLAQRLVGPITAAVHSRAEQGRPESAGKWRISSKTETNCQLHA